jgi:hypothetical protein
VVAGYTFLQIHLHTGAGRQDVETVPDTEGNSPHHQAQIRIDVQYFQDPSIRFGAGDLVGSTQIGRNACVKLMFRF